MSIEQAIDDAVTRACPSASVASQADLAAERARLEAEREACERTLERLGAEEESLKTLRQHAETQSDPALLDRLSRIAAMRSDLRSAFHATLGGLQMLRLDKTLSEQQARQTDMVMSAGLRLFETVFSVLDISRIEHDGATAPGGIAARTGGDATAQDSTLAAAAAHAQAPCLKVLIAEDIDVNRHIAAGFLESAGHGVHMVEDGVGAVIAASTMDFDVILMDIGMPVLDGIEATRRIRALPGARGRTPIVALTACDSRDEIEACRRAGMDAYLAKPFRHDTLTEAILRAAGDVSARASAQAAQAAPKSYAQLLSAERETYRNAVNGAEPARKWLDIVSPWDGSTGTQPPRKAAAPTAAASFSLRLRDVGVQRGQRRLVGKMLTCEPAREGEQHEFHWLVYVESAHPGAATFSARCDLWRWSRRVWQSIAAPGAAFLPDEVFEQGWRYCGPCIDPTAMIEVF